MRANAQTPAVHVGLTKATDAWKAIHIDCQGHCSKAAKAKAAQAAKLQETSTSGKKKP